jgi:uncharacterized spore protein YtfJ
MEDVERLLKSAMGEVERMLSTKTVVGDPITIEGNTLIPLVSLGFGIGAGGGGGTGTMKGGESGEGKGAGTGGGGGVKPVAMIIINKDGVRVESIKGSTASMMESVAQTIGKAVQKSSD